MGRESGQPKHRNGPKWTEMDRTGPNWTELAPQWPVRTGTAMARTGTAMARTGTAMDNSRPNWTKKNVSKHWKSLFTTWLPITWPLDDVHISSSFDKRHAAIPMDNPDIATGRLRLANKMAASYPKPNIIIISVTHRPMVWRSHGLSQVVSLNSIMAYILYELT